MTGKNSNNPMDSQTTQPHAAAQAGLKEWRRIIAAQDWDKLPELLAEGVVYRSPANFDAYHGKATLVFILRAVFGVLQDFKYLRQFVSGTGYALEFSTRAGDENLLGVDLIEFDPEGRITDLIVMMRPASVVLTVAAEAGKRMAAGQASEK